MQTVPQSPHVHRYIHLHLQTDTHKHIHDLFTNINTRTTYCTTSCTILVYHIIQLDGNVKELFAIGSVRSEPEMLPLMDDKILVLKDEVQVGTSTGVIMYTIIVWEKI